MMRRGVKARLSSYIPRLLGVVPLLPELARASCMAPSPGSHGTHRELWWKASQAQAKLSDQLKAQRKCVSVRRAMAAMVIGL